MLKGLMNYGGYRVLGLAVSAALPFAFDTYDYFVNYTPVQARVTRVQDSCYMEKRSGGRVVKSNDYDCRSAESAVKNSALWQGSSITYDINIGFEYVSPVDGQLHGGARALTKWPGGRPLSRGDVLSIRASRIDPDETRGI